MLLFVVSPINPPAYPKGLPHPPNKTNKHFIPVMMDTILNRISSERTPRSPAAAGAFRTDSTVSGNSTPLVLRRKSGKEVDGPPQPLTSQSQQHSQQTHPPLPVKPAFPVQASGVLSMGCSPSSNSMDDVRSRDFTSIYPSSASAPLSQHPPTSLPHPQDDDDDGDYNASPPTCNISSAAANNNSASNNV